MSKEVFVIHEPFEELHETVVLSFLKENESTLVLTFRRPIVYLSNWTAC
jgi:hypothetical protein